MKKSWNFPELCFHSISYLKKIELMPHSKCFDLKEVFRHDLYC